MCSISLDPRCEEYTIWTAVAPDAVFTVRTYGTRQLYGAGLVRKSSPATQEPAGHSVTLSRTQNHEPTQVTVRALAG